MSSLELRYDWVDFSGAALEPIRLTFAEFSITAGGEAVTRVLDRRAQTTRNHVVTPLYPLAEWAASNWWPLVYEPEVPSRGIATAEYLNRHGIRQARRRLLPAGPAVLSRGLLDPLGVAPPG